MTRTPAPTGAGSFINVATPVHCDTSLTTVACHAADPPALPATQATHRITHRGVHSAMDAARSTSDTHLTRAAHSNDSPHQVEIHMQAATRLANTDE